MEVKLCNPRKLISKTAALAPGRLVSALYKEEMMCPEGAGAGYLLHQGLRRVEDRMSTKQTLSHAVPTTSEICAGQKSERQWVGGSSSLLCLNNKHNI